MDGGAGGTRTPDPLHAMQVLSQLSYNPTIGPLIGAIPDARPVRFCLTARRASSASSIAGSHHFRLASHRGVRVLLPRQRVRPSIPEASVDPQERVWTAAAATDRSSSTKASI